MPDSTFELEGTLVPPEKLAPNSPEAEEAVLGSVLINPDALFDIMPFLQSADFFIVRNVWIWEAILAVFERQESIDNLTVIQELRTRKQLDQVGGAAYITSLINNTPTHIHAETYARIVYNAAVRRRLMAGAAAMAQVALEENAPIEDVLEHVTKVVEVITTHESRDVLRSGEDVLVEARVQYANWLADPADIRGLVIGQPQIDRVLGGLEDSAILTLYGKTGSGKTTVAAFAALNLAEQTDVEIVATEMPPKFWLTRAVSDLSGVPYNTLKTGRLTPEQRHNVDAIWDRIDRVRKRLTFYDEGTPSPANILAHTRALRRRGKGHVVILDSMQNIITPGITDIYPQVSAAADMMLRLSRLGCVIVATSQTGRNDKQRADKEPQLTDASGSGKIENNSWMVLGCHRPRDDAEGIADRRVLFILLKSRTGPDMRRIRTIFEPGGERLYTYLPSKEAWDMAAPKAQRSRAPVAAYPDN